MKEELSTQTGFFSTLMGYLILGIKNAIYFFDLFQLPAKEFHSCNVSPFVTSIFCSYVKSHFETIFFEVTEQNNYRKKVRVLC